MTLDELITLTENRISMLNAARANAFGAGDLAGINAIDSDINQTKTTLEQLRILKASLNG